LLDRAGHHPRIHLCDHAPVSSLVKQGGRVVGVRVGSRVLLSNAVVLATGGYAALWGRSTNARESRGHGLGLAWRAGASLADLEFVQFHPTALSLADRPAFLLSEALRGEGAQLVDADGRAIVDPLLARDVVARALHRHLLRGGHAFLTLQHLDPARIHARFERLAATLCEFGLDLARDPLPVAPAAHYCMGGVRVDTWGRTDVPGLYAAGEVACSGVQGANRLASNSLLECLVFGARAAEAALGDGPRVVTAWNTVALPPLEVERAPHTLAALDQAVLGARLDSVVADKQNMAF
jgi:L-aspartate oxidase